ncbi:rod shape-determining protein MreC [Sandaracinobacter neustonicus]|uniref:Cell shape-determining protein MreC n=1 Tax=Sandaracinobacter neustonicus TaxID=1715348 RepID=A0A501XJ93_9SPHN|nr:rod shape-determining protein MreC [Sandaracinobacter neustonicus]TPE60515.1 rod shape-determining protein MreC [Sandaracinobacter neustonicus]
MSRLPPPNRLRPARRTSFARRDSNLALLGALFAGVVIAFALLMLLLQRVNPDLGTRMRGATADALSPIISVAMAPVEGVRRLGALIGDHMNVVDKNRELAADLKAAQRRAAETERLAAELDRMEALLALRRPERRLVASAVASAVSAEAGQRQAILSAGLSDGVKPRMPVIASGGLAGRVTDVGQGASRMMLLTDADSRIPVKVLRTGWTGLAVGTGGTLLDFQFDIASGSDKIRVGDRLVTSGDGGLFPPGIPVAVIIDAEANPPRARPLANPTGLGTVMIEAPWLPPPSFVAAPPAAPEADKVVPAAVPGTAPAAATPAAKPPAAQTSTPPAAGATTPPAASTPPAQPPRPAPAR